MGRRKLWKECSAEDLPDKVYRHVDEQANRACYRRDDLIFFRVDGATVCRVDAAENRVEELNARGFWLAYSPLGKFKGEIAFRRDSKQDPPFPKLGKILGKPGPTDDYFYELQSRDGDYIMEDDFDDDDDDD